MGKKQHGGNVLVAKESYKKVPERERELTIGGEKYYLDDNLNKRDFVAYKNPDTGEVYMGIRGTELGKGKGRALDDLWEDALIATGAEKLFTTTRNKKAERLAQQLIDEAGGDKSKVKLAAHSLGGSVALNTGKKLGLHVDAYNPGSSPLQLYTNLKQVLKPSKGLTNIYSTGVDPISAMAYYLFPGNKRKSEWTAGDPHTLSNFDNLIPEQTEGKKKRQKK